MMDKLITVFFVLLLIAIGWVLSTLLNKEKRPQDANELLYKLQDRWLDTVDRILGKAFSGRFIAIVLDSIIFPGAVILCGYLTHQKLVEPETFIAVLGGYALLVKETRLKYFDRTDRDQTKEENKDEKVSVNSSGTTGA
jgi:hypothetical protein